VVRIERLEAMVRIEELSKAQSRYATARVPYGHVELAAELVPELALRINARRGEVPRGELGGFHRIEEGLWGRESTAGLQPVAERLLGDVEELQRRLRSVELDPVQIATAAGRLLDEIAAVKVAGREEPYGDLDLVDVGAAVEGAEAALKAVRPLLAERDAELLAEVEARFDDVYAGVGEYGTLAREPEQPWPIAPGATFVIYSEMARSDLRRLQRQIEGLADAFSSVPEVLAG
jgi:iron uptake system component EfeO